MRGMHVSSHWQVDARVVLFTLRERRVNIKSLRSLHGIITMRSPELSTLHESEDSREKERAICAL